MPEITYLVVRNDEEQYSIWAADLPIPAGWHDQGFRGSKPDCLAHIDQAWQDMRPRSLRLAMEAQESRGGRGGAQ